MDLRFSMQTGRLIEGGEEATAFQMPGKQGNHMGVKLDSGILFNLFLNLPDGEAVSVRTV
jgi:hypothetical protein